MQYSADWNSSLEQIGLSEMNSLMLQVPAIMHIFSGVVTPVPMQQAATSQSPPATGVPSTKPVSRAAFAVTVPQTSVHFRSGANRRLYSVSPNASKIASS